MILRLSSRLRPCCIELVQYWSVPLITAPEASGRYCLVIACFNAEMLGCMKEPCPSCLLVHSISLQLGIKYTLCSDNSLHLHVLLQHVTSARLDVIQAL